MDGLSGIPAIILAGGMGTRLREVVAGKPKVLAEVNGRPFLAYLLDQVAAAGVRQVVLCTGYMADQVEACFGSRYGAVELRYSREETPLGTGGAVRLAAPLIASSRVLVCNGDSFCDADLLRFAAAHSTGGTSASLVLANVDDCGRYGAVTLAPDNMIHSFEEKGGRQGAGLINAGVYLFNRSVLEMIPPNRVFSLERELFPALISRGLRGFPQEVRFIDIGVPDDYRAAASFFGGSP